MNPIRNRRGYTLTEMMTVVGVMAVIATCTMSMMIGALSSFEGSTVQAETDNDAVTAMQRIVSDIREAKSFTLLSYSTQLRLTFPITISGGGYNRQIADLANQADYYLSDDTGIAGHEGHFLWRSQSGGRRIVARNIDSVEFVSDQAAATRAVKITIVARNTTSNGAKETHLTERVVYLRNY
jgi:prepilin-type N-terminal cleavage/methylation domain-containing protein